MNKNIEIFSIDRFVLVLLKKINFIGDFVRKLDIV